jgi:hypothetical protein
MISGWEFLIINPFDKNLSQSSQKLYNKNYNDSYYKFVQELCIPKPKELFEKNFEDQDENETKNNLFTFYIFCSGNSDKIELENSFEITFLKSVFLKTKYKNIKRDLQNYYRPFDINVRNLYQSGDYIFLIIEHDNYQNNY